jgi:hypothetical protein
MAVFHGCILFDDKNGTSAPGRHAFSVLFGRIPSGVRKGAVTKKDGLNLFEQITDFLDNP